MRTLFADLVRQLSVFCSRPGRLFSVRSSGQLKQAPGEIEGAQAFNRFCKPALSRHRTPDHEQLVTRARFHQRAAEACRVATSVGEIQVYVFAPITEEKASVLLVHGWTGEEAFMAAFAERLRRAGYRAILELAEAIAPVRFALGLSIGAMALLTVGEERYPLPRNYPFEAYVRVSMPDAFGDVTRSFGDELSLSPAALRAFEKRLEDLAGRSIGAFSGSMLLAATQRPSLLLHAMDDDEVSFECAEEMSSSTPGTELQAFDGFGHRAILYAPPAMRCAVQSSSSIGSLHDIGR